MDFSDLLLLLIFVVLPLVQQFLQRRSPSELPDPEREAEEAGIATEPRPGRPSGEAPGADAQWEEFEAWELEAAEELAQREVVNEREAAELATLQSRLPAEPVPEAVRVSSPVVSLETARPETARPPKPPLPALAPPRPHPASRADLPLRGRAQLRRAVLLTEILGPPKSLQ